MRIVSKSLGNPFIITAIVCFAFISACKTGDSAGVAVEYPTIEGPAKSAEPAATIETVPDSTVESEEYAVTAKAEKPNANVVEAAISIAKSMHDRNLTYSPHAEDFRDCSGIFHRLLDELSEHCPLKRPGKKYRSSRNIAAWYNRNNELTLIGDVFEMENLIQPGAVMFYGREKKKYRNFNIETVLTETEHVGIVTSVEKDKKGRVVSYKLFHGRSGSKPAAITNFHRREPSQSYYPPLGNGSQQWIAQAWLCRGSACGCAQSLSFDEKAEPAQIEKKAGIFVEEGQAAYYSNKYVGRKTASGEKYSAEKLTAAHKTLPFGTIVNVTNLENKKSVTVRINDRGPRSPNRVIDLSESAAKIIGLFQKGVATVRIEKMMSVEKTVEKPVKKPLAGTGKASRYDRKSEGRATASGEKYTAGKLTAAHPELPFGTLVKVTNLENGKTVTVRINDRIKKSVGRIIALSESAAKIIGMFKKAGKVRIEEIRY